MGLTIIVKETSADRRRRIYERPAPQGVNMPIEGTARSMDEAVDMNYHLHGELDRPVVVEGGPEKYQQFEDDMKRIGQDPERVAKEWGIRKP